MAYIPSVDWNPKQALLRDIIRLPQRFNEALSLCRELHGMVHLSKALGTAGETLADSVAEGLNEINFRRMPTPKDVTVRSALLRKAA